jgi:hypothetical protein
MVLKRVGFIQEVCALLREDVLGLPSLRDAIRSTGHADKGRILSYLRAGVFRFPQYDAQQAAVAELWRSACREARR